MFMSAFLAISLVNIIHGSNRFSEPHFKAINFAKAVKGRKLDGNVIKELGMTSEASCQFECVKETACLSYNFLSVQGKCQLSYLDRFVGHVNFTQENGSFTEEYR